jgi:hypothetical protein
MFLHLSFRGFREIETIVATGIIWSKGAGVVAKRVLKSAAEKTSAQVTLGKRAGNIGKTFSTESHLRSAGVSCIFSRSISCCGGNVECIRYIAAATKDTRSAEPWHCSRGARKVGEGGGME